MIFECETLDIMYVIEENQDPKLIHQRLGLQTHLLCQGINTVLVILTVYLFTLTYGTILFNVGTRAF